jgi:hypothetical protein
MDICRAKIEPGLDDRSSGDAGLGVNGKRLLRMERSSGDVGVRFGDIEA